MKVCVVAVPWQDYRSPLQAVVEVATAQAWDLTVLSDLAVAPTWARRNYRKYDPSEPLPPCSLLIWLHKDPVPPAPWVITTETLAVRSRWTGTPRSAHWERTLGAWTGHVLSVAHPDAFFQALRDGQGAWPEGTWTGPTLPGRLCPVDWWSRGGWKVHGLLGIERVNDDA